MVVGITHGKNNKSQSAVDKYYQRNEENKSVRSSARALPPMSGVLFLKFIEGPNKHQ